MVISCSSNYSSFYSPGSTQPPPIIKIIINVNDQELVDSKLLYAKINMKEVSDNLSTKNMFFSDYVIDIDSSRVEINTSSSAYLKSSPRLQSNCVYYQNSKQKHKNRFELGSIPWGSKTFFTFDCSISFEYRGQYDSFARTIKQLKSSERVLCGKTLASLLEDDTFADFTFNVHGREFKVHKFLLAKASHVFETMFTCGLDETKNNTTTVDCKPEIFEIFIKFIYMNEWSEHLMPIICYDLYELAHRYQIETLKKICLTFVENKSMDCYNVLDIYEFAMTYQIGELLDSSWKFIKT